MIDKANDSNQNTDSMRFFENIHQSLFSHKASIDDQINGLSNLEHALRLAAQFHLNGLHASEEQLWLIVKRIKQFATRELEPGDGRKVESVRVERRLDGSVSIFFGI